MNVADSIPQDDLLLAQLCTSKLAGVTYGIMSVGSAALELQSPSDFLTGKDDVLRGFLQVLRSVGVNPGHADKADALRRQVDQLLERASQYHQSFIELAHWRTMPSQEIQETADRLIQRYALFFEALEAFGSLLGMDLDYSAKIQQGRSRIEDSLRVLSMNP